MEKASNIVPLAQEKQGATRKRKNKTSSIRIRLYFIGALIFFSVILLGVIVDLSVKDILEKELKGDLIASANNSANLFGGHVREWWEYAGGLSLSNIIQDPDISFSEKAEAIERLTQEGGKIKHLVVDARGRLYTSSGTIDVSKQSWFIDSNGGKNNHFSSPMMDAVDKKLVSIISVPISDFNDNFNGIFQVIIDGTYISLDSLSSFDLEGKTSQIYILDKNGTHIANKNLDFVTKQVNRIEEAKSDPSLKSLAAAMSKAIAEESGLISFNHNGVDRVGSFAKIEETGWTVVITQDVKEHQVPLIALRIKLLVFNIVVLLVAHCTLFFIARSITKPLNRTVDALRNIAEGEGDLTVRLPVRGNDELTQMSAYFNKTMEKIRTAIKKVGGNTVSMQELGGSLSANMSETASAVNQISSNIEGVKQQVINQSASVTETSATMEEIIRTIEQLNSSIETQAA
ncbi:MAG: methyl-accepting chemotaxis protein, partial [Treponemataceae bacterium]